MIFLGKQKEAAKIDPLPTQSAQSNLFVTQSQTTRVTKHTHQGVIFA
jgi:hypothetical protein